MALTLIAAGASAMLAIGRQEDPSITNLETTLDGAIGGSVVDGSVSLPKRVGVNDKRRSDLAGLLVLPLPARLGGEAAFEAIPLSAIAGARLEPSSSAIARRNG